MKKRKRKWLLVMLFLLVLGAGACMLYVNDYYHSEIDVADYMTEYSNVQITEIAKGLYLNGPGEEAALIFYPGAKVEYTSYLPLFYQLAENGVDCFLLKMPANLAILGQGMAEEIRKDYTYKQWYLCGHSLGGAMIASYAAEHPDEIEGLVLLAAYPTESLQHEALQVISLYGSEDYVLNMEKLQEGRKYMPEDYTEICMEGGNHAWFGNYGAQDGDGTASITREEQQTQTVNAILNMILDDKGDTYDENE